MKEENELITFKNILESVNYSVKPGCPDISSLNITDIKDIPFEWFNAFFHAGRLDVLAIESEKERLKAYKDVIKTFSSLPNPIPIYRGLCTYDFANLDKPGISWSFSFGIAFNWMKNHYWDDKKMFVLSSKIDKANVDWITTLLRFIQYSWEGRTHVNAIENEIKLKSNSKELLIDFKVEEYEYQNDKIVRVAH